MSYDLLLFTHIASVILLLGVGAGSAFYKFMADRSGNLEVIVHTNKMVVLADWLFITPSAILQPLTGVLLMNMLNISIWTPWLLASIILYIFAGVLWLVAVYLQIRMKDMALEVQRKEETLGKEYFLFVKYWVILGIFSFLAMASVFVLMVFKP
ncbi:MAG: Membrane protein [uncultured Sulfurovum sp.]|uniref:Membrane protein n=1 Tax=uncultured Sulfurovum sp. TaxID=269237 RepID=A0A6S6SPA6_9BACT|nr:MAG: Membrane protein [uncultured Sulfurovum sp.]